MGETRPDAERKGQHVALWVGVVAAVHFVGDMYPGFISPLVPYFSQKFEGSSYLMLAMLSVAGQLGMFLQPVFGVMSDRIRGKHFIVGGLMCAAMFYCVLTRIPSFPLLVACIFCGALGVSAFHPQSAALAGRLPGSDTGKTIIWYVVGGQSGYAAGMIDAPLIADRLGPEWLVILLPLGFIMAGGALAVPVSPGGRPDAERKRNQRFFQQLLSVKWKVLPLVLFVILRSFAIGNFIFWVPKLLFRAGSGGGYLQAATPAFGFILAGSVGMIVGGWLRYYVSERAMLIASCILGASCQAGFLLTDGGVAFVFVSLAGAALSSTIPLHIRMGHRLLPDNLSAGSALVTGFSWGIGGLMNPLVGAMADGFGALRPALFIVAGVCAMASVLVFLIPTERRGAEA